MRKLKEFENLCALLQSLLDSLKKKDICIEQWSRTKTGFALKFDSFIKAPYKESKEKEMKKSKEQTEEIKTKGKRKKEKHRNLFHKNEKTEEIVQINFLVKII